MKTSNAQRKLTKKAEGCRIISYADATGNLTIGYGHKMIHQKGLVKISWKEANNLFNYDMETVEMQVTKLDLKINQNQFDAICDLVFNIGIGSFKKSNLYKKIKKNPNDVTIYKEFGKWIYGNGKVLKGLQKRREIEANTYFTRDLFDK